MKKDLSFYLKPQLPVVFIADISGSMAGSRFTILDSVVMRLNKLLIDIADVLDVQLSFRVIEYSTEARWIVGDSEHSQDNIENVCFSNPYGGTNTSEALELAKSAMSVKNLGHSSLHPIIFLISDGCGNNVQETTGVIEELKTVFGNKDKILRIAIRIGDDQIVELEEYASVVEDKLMIYDVDEYGYINDYSELKEILYWYYQPRHSDVPFSFNSDF